MCRCANSWGGWRWVHSLAHKLLQALQLSVQLLESDIGSVLLDIDSPWNQVLEAADFVCDAARLVFTVAAGLLELGDHGFDFGEGAV